MSVLMCLYPNICWCVCALQRSASQTPEQLYYNMDPPYRLSPVSTDSKPTLGMLHSPALSPHTHNHTGVNNTEQLVDGVSDEISLNMKIIRVIYDFINVISPIFMY